MSAAGGTKGERRQGERRLYKFVDDLVRIGAREIRGELGTDDKRARDIALQIANSVCLEYARFHVYVPACVELQLDPRNQAIWDQYGQPGPDGARAYSPDRIAQLAAEHSLTDRQIYSILAVMRERELATRQGVLQGFDPTE